MPRLPSTAFRFAAYFSLAFTVVTLVLGTGMYWAVRRELRYELDQRVMTERAAVLLDAANQPGGLARSIATRAAQPHGDMRSALLAARGQKLRGEPFFTVPPDGWAARDFHKKNGDRDDTRGFTSRTADGGLLIVGADPEALEKLDKRMVPLFAAAFGLIVAIAIAGAFLLGRVLQRRLDAINRTAEAIIAGDLARRIALKGSGDEFDRLSATLTRMLDRIAGLLDNLRQVSGV